MARKSRKNTETSLLSQKLGMKIWRAGLYIRLSVEGNGNRGDSLETQRQIMEAHLALYPDIEIVDTYTDNGISGQTFERPDFQRMLADIEVQKIDCVVVKDLSRLGRNAIDSGYFLEKYFPLHNVRVISANDQYDSEAADSGSGQIALPLKNLVNEAYALDIARKVRAQQYRAMQAGEFVGSRPPYGYRKDPTNCHRLLVNEDTAPVVRQIFQWIADGVPQNVVVKLLNKADILTPGYYHALCGLFSYDNKLAGSGVWQSRTVMKILADEVYTGDMVQGKTKKVGHRQVPTDPKEWVVVRNTHTPLVSRELFERAQAVRAQATAKAKATAEKVPYTKNILCGRIICGHCGRSFHRERNQQHRYYYHCIANQRIGKDVCASEIYMREESLFDVILTIIRKEVEALVENGCKLMQSGTATELKLKMKKEIASFQQEMERDRKYLIRLYEDFVTGILTPAEYTELKTGYEQKIKAATFQSQQLLERQKELEVQMTNYIELSDWLSSANGNMTLTGDLMNRLVDRIVVYSAREIKVYFKFKDEFDEVLEND